MYRKHTATVKCYTVKIMKRNYESVEENKTQTAAKERYIEAAV